MKSENRLRMVLPPAILGVIVLMMILYSFISSRLSMEDTANFSVCKNASGIAENINIYMKYGADSIKSAAFTASESDVGYDPDSEENKAVQELLKNISGDTPFDFIEYIGLDGRGITSSGAAFSADNREYYSDASNGKSGIWIGKHPYISEEKFFIDFCAPVKRTGMTEGFMIGAVSIDDNIAPIMQSSFFGEKMDSFLFSDDGRIIASTKDAGTDIFEYLLSVGVNEKKVSSLITTIENSPFNSLSLKTADGEAIAGFDKIDTTNWNILFIIPADSLDSALKGFRSADKLSVSVIISAFGCYILFISVSSRMKSKRISNENKKLTWQNKKISTDAYTDVLTGLNNRRAYEKDWEGRTTVPAFEFVYATLDVNGLKNINDNSGHEAGDELITGAANCMAVSFGKYGKVYRIGGDEFAAVLRIGAKEFEKVREGFEQRVSSWNGQKVKELAVSAGYVFSSETEGMTISDITNMADQRMYQAKSRYYARRGVDRRGNQDAFRAISDTYRLILRAVLNEDECSVIRMESSEENDVRKSISEWVNHISASGIICEEDVEKFRNRFDLSSLTDYFKNNDVMSFSCRRVVDDEIRNVIIDIIRSKDYEEDFQLVYIYIKVIE